MSEILFVVERLAIIFGVIAAFSGVIGGLWQLYDKWKDRKPNLKLFIPHYRTLDDESGAKILLIFVRISNSSSKAAYLYLESMEVHVKTDKWYTCALPPLPDQGLNVTEISETEWRYFGFGKCKYLNKYDDNTVTFDKPVSGYIGLTHFDNPFIKKSIQEVKIIVQDCHGTRYSLSHDTSGLSRLNLEINETAPETDFPTQKQVP